MIDPQFKIGDRVVVHLGGPREEAIGIILDSEWVDDGIRSRWRYVIGGSQPGAFNPIVRSEATLIRLQQAAAVGLGSSTMGEVSLMDQF